MNRYGFMAYFNKNDYLNDRRNNQSYTNL